MTGWVLFYSIQNCLPKAKKIAPTENVVLLRRAKQRNLGMSALSMGRRLLQVRGEEHGRGIAKGDCSVSLRVRSWFAVVTAAACVTRARERAEAHRLAAGAHPLKVRTACGG